MSRVTEPCPVELNDFTWACWSVLVGSCSVQNVTGPVVAAALEPDDPQASSVTSPATASIVPRACLLEIASFIAHLSTGPGARVLPTARNPCEAPLPWQWRRYLGRFTPDKASSLATFDRLSSGGAQG